MKFQLLMALTIASPFWLSLPVSAQGVPSCHLTLLTAPKNIRPDSFQASIRQLAQLKMSADIAQAAGASQGVVSSAKQMSARYQQKFGEMAREMTGRFTEAQLKEMIIEGIQELQGRRAEETKQVNQVRAAHRKMEAFVLDQKIEMTDLKKVTYLEVADVLVGKLENDLVLLDPNNEFKLIFLQRLNQSYAVSSDGHKVFMVDINGSMKIYDFVAKKGESSPNGLIKGTDSSTVISAQGVVVTASNQGHTLEILNSDGTLRYMAPRFSGEGTIDKLKFISDHELLIQRKSEKALYFMDLNTGLTSSIPTSEFYSQIELTPEKDKILLSGAGSYTVIATKDLNAFSQKAIHFPKDFEVKALLGRDLAYVIKSSIIDMEIQSEHFIVNLKDMSTPQFGYSSMRAAEEIESIAADPHHGRTFIFTSDAEIEYQLEIWQREAIN